MFFILSKILFFLLFPFNWLVALLICRTFSKKPIVKRRLNLTILLTVFFFGNEFIMTKLVLAWQPAPVTFSKSATFSAGIILGGYESYDRKGKGYFNGASDRFIQTVKLYKQGTIKKIVVSGSRVVGYKSEPSDFIQQELMANGIIASDIIVDDASRNTFENALFTKHLLDSFRLKPPYVLITSAWHVPRSQKVFAKAGIPTVAYPSHFVVFDKKFKTFAQ